MAEIWVVPKPPSRPAERPCSSVVDSALTFVVVSEPSTVAVMASTWVLPSARIIAIDSDGAAWLEKPVIWLVDRADSAVVVSALSWAPLRDAICETVNAAMSVVFSVDMVVVDRLAI